MKGPAHYDLDFAIASLSAASCACHEKSRLSARNYLERAAEALDIHLDVPGEGTGGLRVVQELALTAAKALCEVRAPAVHGNPSHPDTRERAADVAESLEQARANIVSAWEVLCGRRPV